MQVIIFASINLVFVPKPGYAKKMNAPEGQLLQHIIYDFSEKHDAAKLYLIFSVKPLFFRFLFCFSVFHSENDLSI